LLRLERSLKAPLTYKFVEYKGSDETSILREMNYSAEEKDAAVGEFAQLLGFDK
jgi:hypothetical protein